ncbi:MAG TPA: LPS assembly lipoprotein LptE [Planctomycetaceae bacterium]|jgi:hypothetical protein|nr:LPS assembly lipoprotein LptE [Planctomycetaceae bacterium]
MDARPPQRTWNALRAALCAVVAAVAAAGLSGCGYTLGNAYQSEIRSVCVPIFESKQFRRDVEFQLTEAVQTQIKERTPFRLVKEEDGADTKLIGRILDVRKSVLGTNRYDDARQLGITFVVEVTWEDLRSGEVLAQRSVDLPAAVVQFTSNSDFAPEIGQSLATAYQQAIKDMATQIVDMMEKPW